MDCSRGACNFLCTKCHAVKIYPLCSNERLIFSISAVTNTDNTRQPQGINWQPITQLSARQGMYAIFTSINRAFAINSYKLVATEWEAQYLANHYTHFIEIVPPEE